MWYYRRKAIKFCEIVQPPTLTIRGECMLHKNPVSKLQFCTKIFQSTSTRFNSKNARLCISSFGSALCMENSLFKCILKSDAIVKYIRR